MREGLKSSLRQPFVTCCRVQRMTRHEARSVAPTHRKPYALLAEAGDPVHLSPIRTTNAGEGFQGFFRPTA